MEKVGNRQLILSGDIKRALITLSVPIIINNFIQTLYNLVDSIFVSRLSSVHFAATALVWPILFLFISLGIGISIAGTSILSQLIGADKKQEASDYASQILAISTLISLIITIVGLLASSRIIAYMGGTGKMAEYANIYLSISFIDLIFMFILFNINAIMNSQGNTRIPMLLNGSAAILNIILDPIFIFTFNWGIAGAALATLLSKAIFAFIGLKILFTDKNLIIPNFKNFRFKGPILKKIFDIGFPASIGQGGAALGFIVLNTFIVSYGSTTLAAFGMVNRITSLIMQPAMGIGAALTAIIGQNIGANQMDRGIRSFYTGIRLTSTIGILGCVFLLTFNESVVKFFIRSQDDPAVIDQSINYLRYIAYSMPLMGVFSVLQGLFQGSGNTKYSMFMEVGRLWFVRLPMIILFKNFTSLGSNGIWFSMSFSNLIICIYGMGVYLKGNWKRQVIIRGKLNMDI